MELINQQFTSIDINLRPPIFFKTKSEFKEFIVTPYVIPYKYSPNDSAIKRYSENALLVEYYGETYRILYFISRKLMKEFIDYIEQQQKKYCYIGGSYDTTKQKGKEESRIALVHRKYTCKTTLYEPLKCRNTDSI